MKQHVILCGLGRVGARVLEYLLAAGTEVVVVDTHCTTGDPRLSGATLVPGDCRRPEVLRQAGIDTARGVLILTSDDLVNIATVLLVRTLTKQARVVVRMFNQNIIPRLGPAVENTVALSTSALAAPVLALIARTGEALGALRLEDGRRVQVTELEATPGSALVGRTAGEIAAEYRATILALEAAGGPMRLLQEADPDTRLHEGDRLVLRRETPKQGPVPLPIGTDGESESFPQLLMAGWWRRLGRVIRRTLAEIDLPVKLATAALVSVILGSTLVFMFTMERDTFSRSLFRTISLMATATDMREQDFREDWQIVFVSNLRIVGAALMAVFTAILASYLVRAQLRGALEVRRIPDGGHIVVCGLGNVGYRVVEELVGDHERVVAVERSPDAPFVAAARRLGVAVVPGDAVIPEVLRQANAGTARAVIACTSNDLVNVEVALLTRELNPNQRVITRLADAALARTIRDATTIRLALSIPELAAPAFVAALLGDRVRAVFFMAGRLVGAVDLLVPAGDDLLEGQSVRALAIDYGLLPLLLLSEEGVSRQDLLNTKLVAGDRLTAIVRFRDLQRLLQRERPRRGYAVLVNACPDPARPFLAQLLRVRRSVTFDEAAAMIQSLPLCLDADLTRGQAVDLMALLTREGVAARVVAPPGSEAPSAPGRPAGGVHFG